MNMFETDRSAARGLMSSRKLFMFKHECKLGNAPAHVLFDAISAQKLCDGPARKYTDYEIVCDVSGIPQGVEVIQYDEMMTPSA